MTTHKPVIFNKLQEPLCPNGCGVMDMDADIWQYILLSDYELGYHNFERFRPVVLEARAFCLHCKYTMLVADERIQTIHPEWYAKHKNLLTGYG